jgi:integrase
MPRRREGPTKLKQTGYYFFDEYVGFPPDRKRIRYSLKTKDPLKSKFLWEQEYRKRWSSYYGIESPDRPKKVSFKDATRDFVEYEKNVKRIKEWKLQEDRLLRISELWGDISLSDIKREHIIRLDDHLKGLGRSKATINHYFTLLKSLFNYAIKKKVFSGDNPVDEMKPYLVEEKRREYSPEEIRRIIEAAERIEKEARKNAVFQKHAKRIVLLLLCTGMRLGEVLNLRWENIKDDKIILKRTETKQKREKIIPLTNPIREVFETLRDGRRKDGYIFPMKGRDRKTVWTKDTINKIRKYSGIPDFIFHNIRHTASTIMVSEALGRGASLADIMKVLGHSQVETTLKYVHTDFERMKRAIEILGEKALTKTGKTANISTPKAEDRDG